jgi:hypothetical protein
MVHQRRNDEYFLFALSGDIFLLFFTVHALAASLNPCTGEVLCGFSQARAPRTISGAGVIGVQVPKSLTLSVDTRVRQGDPAIAGEYRATGRDHFLKQKKRLPCVAHWRICQGAQVNIVLAGSLAIVAVLGQVNSQTFPLSSSIPGQRLCWLQLMTCCAEMMCWSSQANAITNFRKVIVPLRCS